MPASATASSGLWARGRDTYARAVERLPRWITAVIALIAVVAGAVLVVRPFASLTVFVLLLAGAFVLIGLGELAEQRDLRFGPALGIVWIAAGVLSLTWPGLTIATLTWIVAGALALSGVTEIVRATRGPERWAPALLGIAQMGLAVLALTWPDVTVFVLAAVFGVNLVIFGVRALVRLIRPSGASWNPGTGARVAGAALALAGVGALTAGSIALSGTPQPDAFYAEPDQMPAAPGVLLRAEPFHREVPANADGWRILYSTTDSAGQVIAASGLVVVPRQADGSTIVAWAHGTTGQAVGCAPSLLEQPFTAGAMPALDAVVDEGWTLVAADYPGLGTDGVQPYLIGEGEGRAVLDAVRAARDLDPVTDEPSTIVWGHSQGGHAALWAGGLAADYAPDLDIAGVAALAPASDLPVLLDDLQESALGTVFGAFTLTAYAGTYADVDAATYVRPGARLLIEANAARCLTDPGTLVSVGTALAADGSVWSRSPSEGALGRRAEENVPRLDIAAPLLLAQGEADTLVTPAMQASYVASRCAAGQAVDYRTYPGADHMGLIASESALVPELLAWTRDRLDGVPATGC